MMTRDALPAEAEMYKQAIADRNIEQLNNLVNNLYPNVMWGDATQSLSEEDRQWTTEALMSLQSQRM